ncbi:MAG: LCP family protein [Candidatus Limnocylindrales bacterium]
MQNQAPAPLRHRSPFVAAFLSFLFPGLGQAYAGFVMRGLAFAAPMVLLIALLGGLLASKATRDGLLAQLTSPTVLLLVLVANAALLLYRLVAIVDAFRLAALVEGAAKAPPGKLTRPRLSIGPLAFLGLLAILVVTPILHVGLARYNLLAYQFVTGISGEDNSGVDLPSDTSGASSSAAPGDTATAGATGTAQPLPQWNGKGRLNILLVGVDQRPGDTTYNTDTMIVASIDPVTKQVAMLSLPRDTEGVPLPPSWPAARYYANGVYPAKINSLWGRAYSAPGLFPFPGTTTAQKINRGYQALKGALGALYDLQIQYYIEVNFEGFQAAVDEVGGVTIDVQMPVTDNHMPIPGSRAVNLYIPSGIQHMDGQQALAYARARHASSDFDRAQRQQRVVVSLREQTDLPSLLQFDRLQSLTNDLKGAVRTDIPANLFPQLVGLVEGLDLNNLRSLVFTPPRYAVECNNPAASCYYSLTAKVPQIRQAVQSIFSISPQLAASRLKLDAEGATVEVLNGSGSANQASNVADELQYLGMNAEVSTINGGRADRQDYPQTVITVYNGAEDELPETIRVLQATFGVTVVTKDDPAITTDKFVLITTGKATPAFKVPQ